MGFEINSTPSFETVARMRATPQDDGGVCFTRLLERAMPMLRAIHDRPYTGTMPPRVTRFSGEARNTIVAATSSTLGQAAKSAFGMAARLAAVSVIEGTTKAKGACCRIENLLEKKSSKLLGHHDTAAPTTPTASIQIGT
jgi:hypothetical protein